MAETQPLRHASRQVVRELGVLAPTFGPLGVSHSACHMLMELEMKGPIGLVDLAEVLRLDKSTASRMVSTLEHKGLVRVEGHAGDRRKISISLTDQGYEDVKVLHQIANRQVEDAIGLLSEEDRSAVLNGMSLYAKALRRARVSRETRVRLIEPQDDQAVAGVIREVMLSYSLNKPGSALLDPEVSQMYRAYSEPRSAFFVAERAGRVVGGGGIAPLVGGDGTVCELRKMYLLPEARGYGFGQKILDKCLEAAREFGFRSCYLETLLEMKEAHRLYERNGFKQTCQPQGNTGHFICEAWYSLDLIP
jgi:putative acetyltransferase